MRTSRRTCGLSRYSFITLALVAIGIMSVLAVLGWGWLREGNGSPESHGNTVRNITFIGAGVLALIFAFWRSWLTERQAATAEAQAETARQALLHERFRVGVDMLGSLTLATRMGGIYALERLAGEHPELIHTQVVKSLCAFVRTPGKVGDLSQRLTQDGERIVGSERESEESVPYRDKAYLPEEVQEVMDFLAARQQKEKDLEKSTGYRLDLRSSQLRNVNLIRKDFREADFRNADLSVALLAEADFSQANMSNANLSGALMVQTDLVDTDLRGAALTGAILEEADLRGADLTGADLSGADLTSANLTEANLTDADLLGADLESANLTGAKLSSVDWEWEYSEYLAGTKGAYLRQEPTETSDGWRGRQGPDGAWYLPARGLTQSQLNEAWAKIECPPDLTAVSDAVTHRVISWEGKGR